MTDEAGGGWLGRLRHGLGRSSAKLGGGIADLFTKRKLDQAALDELEELLISGDLGVAMAARLTGSSSVPNSQSYSIVSVAKLPRFMFTWCAAWIEVMESRVLKGK